MDNYQPNPAIMAADTADIADALINAADAHGDVGIRAAIVLLTSTGPVRLLGRPEVRRYLVSGRPGRIHVAWDRLSRALDAGVIHGSAENNALLTVCLELAAGDTGRALPNLDAEDLLAVVRAIAAATGAAPSGWPPPIPAPTDVRQLLLDAPPTMAATAVSTGFGQHAR